MANFHATPEGNIPFTDEEEAEWAVAQIEFENNKIIEKAKEIRAERNKKLLESDWTQVADAPVDKALWATYRQALRDVPNQEGFPWEITWPDAP